MALKKIISLIFLALAASTAFTAEVTLQNGVDEYDGCVDTYLKIEGDCLSGPFHFRYDNFHNDSLLYTANANG